MGGLPHSDTSPPSSHDMTCALTLPDASAGLQVLINGVTLGASLCVALVTPGGAEKVYAIVGASGGHVLCWLCVMDVWCHDTGGGRGQRQHDTLCSRLAVILVSGRLS